MSSVTALLAAEFEALKAELTTAYEASGMAATGSWAHSLEVQATGTGAGLLGAGYIEGRKPAAPPPSEAIEQWILSKGIAAQLEKDMTVSSLAWLIARKIGREGWQPKQPDIAGQVITPGRLQQIIDKAGHVLLTETIREIMNHIKSIA